MKVRKGWVIGLHKSNLLKNYVSVALRAALSRRESSFLFFCTCYQTNETFGLGIFSIKVKHFFQLEGVNHTKQKTAVS